MKLVAEVTEFIAAHPQYACWAIFFLALSEAIPIVGTVVPGSTLVVAISALATGANIAPWLLLVAATMGAIIGDGLSYWLGQRYHQEILHRWPINQFPQLVVRSEAFFSRYGSASVFLARFTAVVRAFVPLIAGILRMPARQFLAANTLSAVIWAPAHVFPGVMLAIVASLAGAVPDQCSLKTPSTGVHVNWEFAGQMTIAANGINRRWMKLQWHVNLIGQISVRKDDGRRR